MTSTYKDYGYRSAEHGWAQGYVMPHLRRMLGTPHGPILDLGCGNGAMARALLADGYDVYGVDASVSGIEIAAKQSPGRFFVLDVASGQLPKALAEKQFDVVISTEVIEHLYDPRGFFDFVHRILRGGGSSLSPRHTMAI